MEYVNGTLQSIYHEEGRYVKNGSNWHHEYVIRDHLGNNRVFFSDTNGNGFISMSEVSQEAHYYPFGMTMQGSWLSTSIPKNKYRYNGIEQTANLGLDVYNAFYRTLDPSLGRWWQVDPYAESFYSMSPYCGMGNSPLVYSDSEGGFIHIVVGAAIGGVGNLIYQGVSGNIGSFGDGLAAFGIGAGAGALGAATGGAAFAAAGSAGIISGTGGVLGGVIAGSSGGAIGGFFQGTGNALYFENENLGNALNQGFKEGAVGLVIGGAIGGFAGGIRTGIQNSKPGNLPENIWNGNRVAPGRSPWSLINTPKGSEWGPRTIVSDQNSLRQFRAEQTRETTKRGGQFGKKGGQNIEIWDKSVNEGWESLTGTRYAPNAGGQQTYRLPSGGTIQTYIDKSYGGPTIRLNGEKGIIKLRFLNF
ncbi:RHS repeat-associated core domain-containing protein [Phaeodactylibacter xiamenensis]|uniref:RHS repeat protein n=1 Tax=Phaeodactylibacter xiamenensis TaxID=1524460 RepID=UPI003BA869B3